MTRLSVFPLMVAALIATPAFAADLSTDAKTRANPWDIGFGATIASDYNLRGITQSAHKPSVWGYFEPRLKLGPSLELYAGIGGESIEYPNRAAAEIDFYAGVRPSIDKFNFDFGFWYYRFPGSVTFNGLGLSGPNNTNTTCTNLFMVATPLAPAGACNAMKGNVNFWEAYAKVSATPLEGLTLGANLFYSPSWLNSGASGTYAAITAKYLLPNVWFPKDFGGSISGEYGYYWFGTTDAFYGVPAFPSGIKYPDYATWNLGFVLSYKTFNLDLRYYDTNLSKTNCNVLTGDHTAVFAPSAVTPANPSGLASNWCGAAFIAKFSADLTLSTMK